MLIEPHPDESERWWFNCFGCGRCYAVLLAEEVQSWRLLPPFNMRVTALVR